MSINGLRKPDANHLNAGHPRQVLEALAEIARAFLEFVSATGGKSGKNNGTVCHTSAPAYPAFSTGNSLSELLGEFMRAKAKSGRSMRYLRTLRVTLKSFAKGRGAVPIENITVADIEAWLDCQDWSPRTKRGYLSDLRTMLNFAVRRQMLQHNPAAGVELPLQESAAPGIHTPDQVRAVLEFAREYNPSVCRALAIRYFARLEVVRDCEHLERDERGREVHFDVEALPTGRGPGEPVLVAFIFAPGFREMNGEDGLFGADECGGVDAAVGRIDGLQLGAAHGALDAAVYLHADFSDGGGEGGGRGGRGVGVEQVNTVIAWTAGQIDQGGLAARHTRSSAGGSAGGNKQTHSRRSGLRHSAGSAPGCSP